jgi:hypothetical protein
VDQAGPNAVESCIIYAYVFRIMLLPVNVTTSTAITTLSLPFLGQWAEGVLGFSRDPAFIWRDVMRKDHGAPIAVRPSLDSSGCFPLFESHMCSRHTTRLATTHPGEAFVNGAQEEACSGCFLHCVDSLHV